MLKQSLIEEKLNDINNNKILQQSQLPQWSRVQFGKNFTTNIKRNSKFNLPPVSSAQPQPSDSQQHLGPQIPEGILKRSDSLIPSVDANSDDANLEASQRLRYLEKSIKFIQEQHNETLNGLHDEIEKLRVENRDLHFKLATLTLERNSFDRTKSAASSAKQFSSSSTKATAPTTSSNVLTIKDPIMERKFNKVLDETAYEENFDKRLSDIKSQYENKKLEELIIRLHDAENKNDYLSGLVAKLQDKRNLNSAHKPNDDGRRRSQSSITTGIIGIHHIYSMDPLKICMNENEAPREPNYEECEILVKKLFEVYKQQKQQISNMKAVLKDMLHTENLSNQGMMMTRDVLENSNRLTNKYQNDAGVNILTPTRELYTTPRPLQTDNQSRYIGANNSNGVDMSQQKQQQQQYQQQHIDQQAASKIQLPPLTTANNSNNNSKLADRQRRTQLLQKQRLRKDNLN